MSATVERRYALTKVAAGDYLLPSSDARTLWRIRRYVDGPSAGITDWPRDREVWGVWRWLGEVAPGEFADPDDWDRWEHHAGLCATRADAIAEALAWGDDDTEADELRRHAFERWQAEGAGALSTLDLRAAAQHAQAVGDHAAERALSAVVDVREVREGSG